MFVAFAIREYFNLLFDVILSRKYVPVLEINFKEICRPVFPFCLDVVNTEKKHNKGV